MIIPIFKRDNLSIEKLVNLPKILNSRKYKLEPSFELQLFLICYISDV